MTGGWVWSLSEDAHQNAKMPTSERLNTFVNNEHLQDLNGAVSDDLGEAASDILGDAVGDGWEGEI